MVTHRLNTLFFDAIHRRDLDALKSIPLDNIDLNEALNAALFLDYREVSKCFLLKPLPAHPAKTIEIVRFLLENGADAQSGIWLAKSLEVVELLIQYGADVNTTNGEKRKYKSYVLDNAISTNNFDKVRVLLDNGAIFSKDCLHEVKNVQIAEIMIQHGADVNALDRIWKRTPLVSIEERKKFYYGKQANHGATKHDLVVLIKYLKEHGAVSYKAQS